MKINVVLLGQYRLAGPAHEFALEMPPGATAETAVQLVRKQSANGGVIPLRPVVAVNHTQARLEQVLQDGDELALLPPVAGG